MRTKAEFTVSPVVLLVAGSAVVALAVAASAFRRRGDAVARPLAVMMLLVVAWAVPHAISMAATGAERTLLWERLRFPGTVFAPLAFTVVAARYAGYDEWVSRRVVAALSVVPLVTVAVVWTPVSEGLYWTSVSIVEVAGVTTVDAEGGPWYWVNLGYLYLVTAVGLALLGLTVVRSGPIYRKQSALMFVGGVVPLAVNASVNLGVGPAFVVDLTTTALAVTGVTFALALFHFDLLDVRPVARDQLLEELDDGVVVVGPNGRIRDFNRTADRVLGGLALEQPAAEVLPTDVAPDGGEIAVEVDDRERLFRTRSSALVDGRGEETGRIVYLNDVTEVVEREQRISVLNRVLRHNIRNELNVADGHLEALSEGADGARLAHLREARDRIDRITAFADKAREVQRTFRETDSTTALSADAVAERTVAEARESHPAAALSYVPPEGDATVEVVDGTLFETALAELVENGIVHNDGDAPEVTVSVERRSDAVEVRVADDGPGVPESERRVLDARAESSLEHGSGLGLWLVKWTAVLSNGELSFADGGREAVLSLPAGDGAAERRST